MNVSIISIIGLITALASQIPQNPDSKRTEEELVDVESDSWTLKDIQPGLYSIYASQKIY